MTSTGIAGVTLFGVMFILLILGAPISIAIGLSSMIVFFQILPVDMSIFTAAQKMVGGMDSFALLALPFFILSGNLMNKGGIAIRLIRFSKLLGGWLPGYLAHTNIIGNMLFGAMSGSASAAAAAIGGVMYPIQKEEGYDPAFVTAVNVASAPTGILIPPSGALIVYSLVAEGTSIAALFFAGYIPGILMGLSVMVVALVFAIKNKYAISPFPGISEAVKIVFDAIPSLLLIVVIIGGITVGAFTATEGAAVAALYSFILALLYKTLTVQNTYEIFLESMATTGMILFLIATSTLMSYVMSYTRIPQAISELVLSMTSNKYVLLLIINIFLLIVGTFMDLTPAVLIFTPIFLPIVESLGMHPVQFGVVLIFNLAIGLMTPPVGAVLFVGCSVSKVSLERASKLLIPYFIVLCITLLMVTYIPVLSLGIPQALGLIK